MVILVIKLKGATDYSLVPTPSSVWEERGRVWNITPGGSVPKECCAQVIMTRNLAFVVSRAYKEFKLHSYCILLKCACVGAVHAARLGTFCRLFEYSDLIPCIVANQHLSRISAFETLPPRVMFQTLPLSSHALEGLGTRLGRLPTK